LQTRTQTNNPCATKTAPSRLLGSLRARLLVTALLWIVIAIPVGGIALALSFRAVVAEGFDDRLRATLLMLIGATEMTPDDRVTIARPLGDDRFDQVYSGWYWLIAPEGDTPLRSRSLWDLPDAQLLREAGSTPTLRTFVDASGNEIRAIAQRVLLPKRTRPVTFIVTGNLEQVQRDARDFNRLLWLALITSGAGLVVAIVIHVAIGLRPLQRVAREVEQIRSGKLSQLGSSGLSEIDLLVSEVNTLIDHDRKQFERSRENAANLAHSLKTPLSILRATFEGAEHAEQREQLDTVQRLIDRQLARSASAGPRPGITTDVEPALHAIVNGLRRVHAARQLEISLECSPNLRFAGDGEDLEEILGNVLDNACKWARSRVVIATFSKAQRIIIRVDDDGPGMSDAEATRATERGLRFDEHVAGTGLGLAIVSDLVEMYRGRLTLGRSKIGGTRVEVELDGASATA